MMAGKFLNLDERPKIGSGLKKKVAAPRGQIDREAVAETGRAHGFDRTTAPSLDADAPRRGRPPLNEDMTYWRIYLPPSLRDELSALRDEEGRRLSDLLEDMLKAYKAQKR